MSISDDQYLMTQQRLLLLAGFVKDLPLKEFLEWIHTAETVAPLFHPSLYQRGAPKLELVKRLAQGARAFQKAIPELEEFVEAQHEQDLVTQLQGGGDV